MAVLAFLHFFYHRRAKTRGFSHEIQPAPWIGSCNALQHIDKASVFPGDRALVCPEVFLSAPNSLEILAPVALPGLDVALPSIEELSPGKDACRVVHEALALYDMQHRYLLP